ncbi:MAG: hypothetical protein ACFFAI_14775 [Promethearchaeota archaeon]
MKGSVKIAAEFYYGNFNNLKFGIFIVNKNTILLLFFIHIRFKTFLGYYLKDFDQIFNEVEELNKEEIIQM